MKPILNTLIAAAVLSTAACGGDQVGQTDQAARDPVTEGRAVVDRAAASEAEVVVFKSPTCGCCEGWIDHLRQAGYTVEAVDLTQYADLAATKDERGVPGDLESCHTAVIDGYTIEGHVPAEVIARLLRERPDVRGLSVPGMPIGSPGMEGPGAVPYDVIAFTDEGERTVFERVDPTQPNSDAK